MSKNIFWYESHQYNDIIIWIEHYIDHIFGLSVALRHILNILLGLDRSIKTSIMPAVNFVKRIPVDTI